MADTCPCCGQAVDPGALGLFDYDANTLVIGGRTVRFEPRQADIWHVLLMAYPDLLSADTITERVHGLYRDPVDRKSITVQVHRMRKRIAGLPVTILSFGHAGYRLARQQTATGLQNPAPVA